MGLLLSVGGAWADAISLPCTKVDFAQRTGFKFWASDAWREIATGASLTADYGTAGLEGKSGDAYYGLGSGRNGAYCILTANNETAQDYVIFFKMKEGDNNSGAITVSFTDQSDNTKVYTSTTANCPSTSNVLRDAAVVVTGLPIGTYDMKISFTANNTWAPNIADMAILAKSDVTPYSTRSMSVMDLSKIYTSHSFTHKANEISSTRNGYEAVYLIDCAEAGTYSFDLEASACNENGSLDVTVTGATNGTVSSTANQAIWGGGVDGKWNENWKDYSIANLDFVAGLNIVRMKFNSGSPTVTWAVMNIRNAQFTKTSPLNAIPGTSFDMSIGVTTANSNAGFKAKADNLDSNQKNSVVCYAVNTTAAGNYVLNFLMTSKNTDQSKVQFVVTDENGTQISDNTVSIAKTDDWGKAYANSYSVNLGSLPVGRNTIKMTFTADNTWVGNVFDMQILQALSLDETTAYTPAAGLANVTMARTMTANQWQTFVAPFAMTAEQVTAAFGTGAKVAILTGISGDALSFETATATEANVPVMVYPTKAVSEITADGVTIVAAEPTQTVSPVSFVGNYSGQVIIPVNAYFVANNNLYQASGSGNTIKNFRAYFTTPSSARLAGMTFDGETTGIEAMDIEHSTLSIEHYYDLQGRRVAQPTKGLYIVNGKKVIIK